MSILEAQIAKLVPPHEINWNWGGNTQNYVKQFSELFIKDIFPYLLQTARKLNISSDHISLLDIGCGWAPMAIPVVIYKSGCDARSNGTIQYLGIDIREDAINWLSNSYAEYNFIRFHHHKSKSNIDYIGDGHLKSKTISVSNGDEAKYILPNGFTHNWQWSSSVFTHLTTQACVEALKTIRKSCEEKSMQINTWLIIDNESKYSLMTETTDRKLPIDCGDFLTYSEDNPLVCTCYKIEVIEKMYAESGLEIVHIDRGHWRGTRYRNEANHYQDIIVSRPIR